MTMFAQYRPTSRSAMTFVTASGVIFSELGSGHLKGRTTKLSASMVRRLLSGELLVATPRSGLGAFGDRVNGRAPTLKASAKLRTLKDAILRDPRAENQQDREACWNAIVSTYQALI